MTSRAGRASPAPARGHPGPARHPPAHLSTVPGPGGARPRRAGRGTVVHRLEGRRRRPGPGRALGEEDAGGPEALPGAGQVTRRNRAQDGEQVGAGRGAEPGGGARREAEGRGRGGGTGETARAARGKGRGGTGGQQAGRGRAEGAHRGLPHLAVEVLLPRRHLVLPFHPPSCPPPRRPRPRTPPHHRLPARGAGRPPRRPGREQPAAAETASKTPGAASAAASEEATLAAEGGRRASRGGARAGLDVRRRRRASEERAATPEGPEAEGRGLPGGAWGPRPRGAEAGGRPRIPAGSGVRS